jgi:hypothetical protein
VRRPADRSCSRSVGLAAFVESLGADDEQLADPVERVVFAATVAEFGSVLSNRRDDGTS